MRCAPVRDAVLDTILSNSHSPPHLPYSSEASSNAETTASSSVHSSLPARIVAAFKDLLHFMEIMSTDLSSAALTTVNDDELATDITGAAHEGERRITDLKK
ncbi:hypothetical protein EW145_g8659 [Phellinidium pouzarii]|uniref:Uncharacterized protein n=1 Tax=Phellinidium pouzarii TaxID=167371 RepID=A0A4V3X926_9AGAM|nr:hypothetical protein EW145_g8659 [Phellinidium pouzarii]